MSALPPDKGTVNKIFGCELPQEAPDETAAASESADTERDRWLRDNVPPHHH
jgi:hypothetical protein